MSEENNSKTPFQEVPSQEVPVKESEPVEKNETTAKTATVLKENLDGLLCYVFGFITGIIFLVIDKESQFVKFHAIQSILFSVMIIVLNFVLDFIPVLGWILSGILNIVFFVLWIIVMVKAYKMEKFKIPIIGNITENQL